MAYEGIEAKIPLGDLALVTDSSGDKLSPNALCDAKNISVTNAVIEKAPGTYKYNSVSLGSSIVAIHDYWPTTVQQRLIALTTNGNVYRDTGGRDFGAQIAINSGLGNLQANCKFVEGGQESAGRNKKLFLFTYGVNQLQVLSGDGTAFAALTSPSVDWIATNYPKCGCAFRGRLWAFAGQISYGSDTADHTNFASNYLAMAVYPGEGGEIRGCFVYKTKLFAFKDGGFIYILNDSDSSSLNWYWQRIGSNFGLSAPNALAEVIDTLILGNTSGNLSAFNPTLNTGGFQGQDLMREFQMSKYFRANANRSGVPVQHLMYYPDKKQLFATYRSGYFPQNDELLVIDYNTQQPRVAFWPKGNPVCLGLRKDINLIARPMYGDSSGYVHLMDAETRSEGVSGGSGTAYQGMFQTDHTDFSYLDQSLSAKEKQFDFLAVTYNPEGPHNLSCDYYIDGRYIETINFPMNGAVNKALGTFTLGTDRMAQSNTETSIQRLRGTGRTFSAKFYNNGANQSFQVAAITVFLRPGAEKVTR